MQFVKIQIPNRADSARANLEMVRLGRIDFYGDNTYMVPEDALAVLADLGVAYRELARGGFDFAQKTLRDTLADHAQRWPNGRSRQTPANR